ncbi:hypothetical protein AURDEDRAFT_185270 [Auricularia subglabra TFB-10046 SS5]|nr:hypothetical protein AURDEDRAFT_185270 [Auricularia subglabra TFB-10046 SS5]
MAVPSVVDPLRWLESGDPYTILHADADPSYAQPDEPFAFSKHLVNGAPAPAPMQPVHHGHHQQQQQQHRPGARLPPRAPSSGFASPTTASLSTASPFGLSSPSSVDDTTTAALDHQHAFQYPPHHHPPPPPPPPPTMPQLDQLYSTAQMYQLQQPHPPMAQLLQQPPRLGQKRPRALEDTPGMEPPPTQREPRKMYATRMYPLQEAQGMSYFAMKCNFTPPNTFCDRCIKKGHSECRVEGRVKKQGPNAREILLRQMKEKDALIAGLLKHIFDPHMGTPLALAASRIDPATLSRNVLPPSPSETASEDERPQHRKPSRDTLSSIERLEQHAQKAGPSALLSLVSQAGASLRAPPAWKLEEDSGDESDEDSDEAGEDEDDERARVKAERDNAGPGKLHSIPGEQYPLGLLARISLQDTQPTPLETAIAKLEHGGSPTDLLHEVGKVDPNEPTDAKNPPIPKIPPSNIGLENPRYFHPGPAANLDLRKIIIERQMSIEILDYGIVTLDEVDALFEIFYKRVNPALSILDEQLHTPVAVRKRCPFLFTVVCAAASRYYLKRPELYPMLMHFAKKQAASSLIDGWKSVELCQAYFIMGDYAPSARRWEEDRSYLYKGLAIRIAMDLNLHQPSRAKPVDEMHAREILNCTRTWLICFNIDRSASTQFGKCATLPSEDPVVRASKEWYQSSPYNHPYDVHLCAYVQLLRLMTQFHDIVQDKGAMTMNKNIDYLSVARIYDDQLTAFKEEWTERFRQTSDPKDPAAVYRVHLMPVIVNYCKLVMYSFGFQHAFEKGLARGDPFFLRCWNAATSVVRGMSDVLGPTGFLRYTAECHFVFGTFASGFLFKLLRPEFAAMVDADQKKSILSLVTRLADVLERNAIDDTHAPRLYARFLYSLVRKHAGPGELPPSAREKLEQKSSSTTPPASKTAPPEAASSSSVSSMPPPASGSGSRPTSSRSSRGPGSMPPPPPPVQQSPQQQHQQQQQFYQDMQFADSASTSQQQQQQPSWALPAEAPDAQMQELFSQFGLPPQQHQQQPQHQYSYDDPSAQQQFQQSYFGDYSNQQQQYMDPSAFTQDMDLDQMLLPMRAITSPGFNSHVLMPGWTPRDGGSSASSSDGTAQSYQQTDFTSFLAASQQQQQQHHHAPQQQQHQQQPYGWQ